MIVWIALIATVGLFAITLHTWMQASSRRRRLQAEIDSVQRQAQAHKEQLDTLRGKVDRTKADTETLLREKSRVENEVFGKRQTLTELEQRLERSRPKERRVDKDQEDDLFG